jgi:hypothetical protein
MQGQNAGECIKTMAIHYKYYIKYNAYMETMNCRQRHRKGTFHGKARVILEWVEGITYVIHMLHLLTGDVCSIRKSESGI